ncbi:hypothetical protein BDZ45DRAFT_507635 [Acephala macrosclerotiorum]|nr:hypothetical protein BDZ45DRAFT_507635 [Acephala macrosclerotiorum]
MMKARLDFNNPISAVASLFVPKVHFQKVSKWVVLLIMLVILFDLQLPCHSLIGCNEGGVAAPLAIFR